MAAAFDPNTIDWNLLRAFVAVLEHGSLTRAAQRLGASQPTLSRQISALEASVGAPLFERAARRLKPTPQAQALAEPAARMLAAVQAMAHGAGSAASQLAGTVRLTASEVTAAHILPPLLSRLAQQHPEIQVELVASNDLNNLLEREADIAVRMVRPTQGTLIARHLADWPLGFYAHQSHLAGLPPVTPQNLLQQRWIGFDQSMQMIEGFRASGFEVDRRLFHFRCDNQIVCYEAIRAGLGMGIAIVPLAEREPGLTRLLPELALPVLPVWLTAHRELRSSRRLRLVFDFLAEALVTWAGPAASSLSDVGAAQGPSPTGS